MMDAPQWNGSDPGDGLEPDRQEFTCSTCQHLVDEGDVLQTIYGTYCGDECAAAGEREFWQYMEKQGFAIDRQEQE